MIITIRHAPDCPSVAEAERRVREAVSLVDEDAEIVRELVASAEDAVRTEFVGSPTILIDGRDHFAAEGELPAMACRLYRNETGLDGAPTVAQLAAVLGRKQ